MKLQIDNKTKTLEFTEELTVEELLDITDLLKKFKGFKIVFNNTIYIHNPWDNPCTEISQYPLKLICPVTFPTTPIVPYYITSTACNTSIDEVRG